MGTVLITVGTARKDPYGMGAQTELKPSISGPARLARLFEAALSRSQRRLAERRRAQERRRRRPDYRPYVSIREVETPRGWHRKGDCPQCAKEA